MKREIEFAGVAGVIEKKVKGKHGRKPKNHKPVFPENIQSQKELEFVSPNRNEREERIYLQILKTKDFCEFSFYCLRIALGNCRIKKISNGTEEEYKKEKEKIKEYVDLLVDLKESFSLIKEFPDNEEYKKDFREFWKQDIIQYLNSRIEGRVSPELRLTYWHPDKEKAKVLDKQIKEGDISRDKKGVISRDKICKIEGVEPFLRRRWVAEDIWSACYAEIMDDLLNHRGLNRCHNENCTKKFFFGKRHKSGDLVFCSDKCLRNTADRLERVKKS